MENTLIQTSTLRTLDSSSFVRSFIEKSFTGKRSTPKNLNELSQRKRLSICDERLLKVFLSKPDQPLDTTQESHDVQKKANESFPDENTPPSNGFIHVSSNICQHFEGNPVEIGGTPQCKEMSSSPKTPASSGNSVQKENPVLARIQRDLNSPSAGTRIRALRALKNPTKCSYNNFDVPHDEQDIITEEERISPLRPKSIQEVMKDVVVYVEVRTGEDNRSAGVKKVISLLGARVNDKFLRDTTHVVFKDGLQSTYNKAKKWNIPIVSILWIEACKKQMKLMNPKLFPISNVERYENPELFSKSKRQKSMQPHAEECNRRNRAKTTKETEVGKTVKISSAIRIPRKPKDKLDEIFSEFQEKLMSTPDDNEDCVPFESKLLQRIRNSPFTPKSINEMDDTTSQKSDILKMVSNPLLDDDFEESTNKKTPNAKKSLNFNNCKNENLNLQSHEKNKRSTINANTPRRRTVAINGKQLLQIDRKSNNSSETDPTQSEKLFLIPESSSTVNEPPVKNQTSRRRRTIFSNGDMQICTDEDVGNSDLKQNNKNKVYRRTSLTNKNLDTSSQLLVPSVSATAKKSVTRRTLYSPLPMEQSNVKSIIQQCKGKSRASGLVKTNERRKTILNPACPLQEISDSSPKTSSESSNLEDNSREGTAKDRNNVKTPRNLLEEHAVKLSFSSAKTPQNSRRRTIFDISMDIIGQRVQTINKSAKQNTTCDRILSQEHSTTPICKVSNNNADKHINQELSNNELIKTVAQTEVDKDGALPDQFPKKRRLFAPSDMILTPPTPLTQKVKNSSQTSKRIRENDDLSGSDKKKRRRTLLPPSVPPVPSTQSKINRRSTMDFQTAKKIKMSSAMSSNGAKLPFLVYTNMHSEQIDFIKKAVTKLGRFQIEDTVSENTTHVVTLEPRRTLNLLRGIIRGLWILSYNWITDSVQSGKWLLEDQYEVRNFSRAVEICRSERQAFGTGYKVDVFGDCGPIYVSKSSSVPSAYITELITLSAGKVVDSKKRAKYIIGEYCDKYPDKVCLQPQWILDSITNIHLKKIHKYIIRSDFS